MWVKHSNPFNRIYMNHGPTVWQHYCHREIFSAEHTGAIVFIQSNSSYLPLRYWNAIRAGLCGWIKPIFLTAERDVCEWQWSSTCSSSDGFRVSWSAESTTSINSWLLTVLPAPLLNFWIQSLAESNVMRKKDRAAQNHDREIHCSVVHLTKEWLVWADSF